MAFAVPFDDVSLVLPLGSSHLPFGDDVAFDYLHASTSVSYHNLRGDEKEAYDVFRLLL